MEDVVKVTRRGQTTIPAKLRVQYDIEEGDKLVVEATEAGILFKKVPRLEDLAGADADYATPQQVNKMIDKLREEY
ncbi:MAG: AbrB/MazE/SpoVT family DNA-binding domain-containing protein [Candidatus Bathyarchaeia archaeon]|jgi:AbrB family looped-hinge helix DNA binding protein